MINTDPEITSQDAEPGRAGRQRSMTQFATLALSCLYQHRLCSTDQLRRLLTPNARSATYAKRQLGALRTDGLVSAIAHRRPGESLWFCTLQGAQIVEEAHQIRPRDYRMDATRAAGPAQAHTLAVTETGLAFVQSARTLGHECGPLDWTPEVAHRLRSGPRGRFNDDYLVCDALLHYLVTDPRNRRRTQLQIFIELDRATMTVARLAAKIMQYARYFDYIPSMAPTGHGASVQLSQELLPAWRYRYPRFPRLLIVFAGKLQPELERRTADLTAHLAELPYLHRARPGFTVAATTLIDLHQQGPFAHIITPLLMPDAAPRTILL